MAKQKMELVLEYLINKNEDKATELLHQIFVEKAREIHESLMNEDEFGVGDDLDALEGEEGEMAFEEYFGDEEVEGEDTESEDGEEGEGADASADAIADDIEAGEDAGEDVEGAEAVDLTDLEAKIEDVKADLEAKFAELQAKLEGADTDDAEDDEDADTEEGADCEDGNCDTEEGEEDADEANESASIYNEEDVFEELDALLGEDFDDLTESALDNLEKVSTSNNDGAEVGKGGKVAQNTSSPVVSRPAKERAGKATPIQTKGSQHSGYDRESAPAVKDAKKATNTRGKSTEGTSKVSKKGDESAVLNSGKGFGSDDAKSPIGSAKK